MLIFQAAMQFFAEFPQIMCLHTRNSHHLIIFGTHHIFGILIAEPNEIFAKMPYICSKLYIII